MFMMKPMKKAISICLLGIWVLLFSVQASEALGCLENTQEHSEQSIEQILFTPIDINPHISQQISVLKPSFEISLESITIPGLFHSQELGPKCHLALLIDASRIEAKPPLFQLFSVLRL